MNKLSKNKNNYWLSRPNLLERQLNDANSRLTRININDILIESNEITDDEALTFLIECIAYNTTNKEARQLYRDLHREYPINENSIYDENYVLMHKYSSLLVKLTEDNEEPKPETKPTEEPSKHTETTEEKKWHEKSGVEHAKDFYASLRQTLSGLGGMLKSGFLALVKTIIAIARKLKCIKLATIIFGIVWACKPLLMGPGIASALGLSATMSVGSTAVIGAAIFVAYWFVKGALEISKLLWQKKEINAKVLTGIDPEKAKSMVRKYEPFVTAFTKEMRKKNPTEYAKLQQALAKYNENIEEKYKYILNN